MSVQIGTEIPSWTMPSVDPARMKTMAAILRDPYPVHWDHAAVAAIGRGDRVINQGPLSLSYIANMLMAWQGPECIRRLTASFRIPVLEGDEVIARGTVVSLETVGDELRATCDVRLEREGEGAVIGTAVVAVSESDAG